MQGESVPKLAGILETSLYVADLQQSIAFYQKVFCFEVLYSDHRMCAMAVRAGQVLLLFLKGASAKGSQASGGFVPGSDGEGHLHLAFSISKESLGGWKDSLQAMDIPIESTVYWPAGGTSLYFRDPDQHVLELATPGLWANY
jgi:catechol 2,3-dioxygenase-like lactoylglutathione lyase family enzyme